MQVWERSVRKAASFRIHCGLTANSQKKWRREFACHHINPTSVQSHHMVDHCTVEWSPFVQKWSSVQWGSGAVEK